MNAIEMKGLTKFYGKARGIVGLDLAVSEGEFFGFIGPNGAGKSTTIRTLLGLIKGSGGSARIFGKDIAAEKKTASSWRQAICLRRPCSTRECGWGR